MLDIVVMVIIALVPVVYIVSKLCALGSINDDEDRRREAWDELKRKRIG